MYCVKCGRKARPGEKRCPVCSTRLVTAKQLSELLKLKKQVNRKKRKARKDLLQRFCKGVRAFWLKLCAVALILWQTVRNLGIGVYDGLRTAYKRIKQWIKQKKAKTKTYKTAKKPAPNNRTKNGTRPQIKAYKSTAARTEATTNRSATVARKSTGKPVKTNASGRTKNETGRTTAGRTHSAYKRTSRVSGKSRSRRVIDSLFSLKHIRTTVAVILLLFTVITVALWGTLTDSGQRSFAKLGAGSWRGYILLGDDYMAEYNYTRAVECYYTSIRKQLSLEGTYKLAAAYSYTGDISREVNALLACVKNYPDYKMAYVQLYRLFPYEETRPDEVERVINLGFERFGDLE